jgi:hypothetical protein
MTGEIMAQIFQLDRPSFFEETPEEKLRTTLEGSASAAECAGIPLRREGDRLFDEVGNEAFVASVWLDPAEGAHIFVATPGFAEAGLTEDALSRHWRELAFHAFDAAFGRKSAGVEIVLPGGKKFDVEIFSTNDGSMPYRSAYCLFTEEADGKPNRWDSR